MFGFLKNPNLPRFPVEFPAMQMSVNHLVRGSAGVCRPVARLIDVYSFFSAVVRPLDQTAALFPATDHSRYARDLFAGSVDVTALWPARGFWLRSLANCRQFRLFHSGGSFSGCSAAALPA